MMSAMVSWQLRRCKAIFVVFGAGGLFGWLVGWLVGTEVARWVEGVPVDDRHSGALQALLYLPVILTLSIAANILMVLDGAGRSR